MEAEQARRLAALLAQEHVAVVTTHGEEWPTATIQAFAETDNLLKFQLGVDNVRIDPISAPIPEPASMLLLGAALAVLAGCRVGARSRRALG